MLDHKLTKKQDLFSFTQHACLNYKRNKGKERQGNLDIIDQFDKELYINSKHFEYR